jgi:formate hydrogenlyase subunit 6/NADH:ubiquinone oxidoreductase subunit I
MLFMTPQILKNLFRPSATRHYPLEAREPFARSRGQLAIEIDGCVFCGACARKCPSDCIAVDKANARWTLDPMACVGCGVCVEACPKNCLIQAPHYRRPHTAREVVAVQGEIKPHRPAKKAAPRSAPPKAA